MYQYPYGNAQQLNLDWILGKLKELESGSGGGVDLEAVSNALIALTYAEQNYNRSDIVFYNGKLYRANQNITAEAWNAAHWDEILLGDTVANLVRYVGSLNNSQVFNSSTVAGTHTSDALNNLAFDISRIDGSIKSGYPKLAGKRIIIYGDSISDESSQGSGFDMQPNWVSYLRDHCTATIDNRAISGKAFTGNAGIGVLIDGSDDLQCDKLVIFAGVNDYRAGRQLGYYGSTVDYVTLWGSLTMIYNKMKTACPTATIYVVSPLKHVYETTPDTTNKYRILAMYRKVIQAFCTWRGWVYIDGYTAPLLNPFYTTYFQPDKLHPNYLYSPYLCNYIASKLEDDTGTEIGDEDCIISLVDLANANLVSVSSLTCTFSQDTGECTVAGSVTYTNTTATRYDILELPSHLFPVTYVGASAYGTLSGEGITGTVWIGGNGTSNAGKVFLSLASSPSQGNQGTCIFAVRFKPIFAQQIVNVSV